MTLPTEDTRVLYPSGAVDAQATVLHTEPLSDGRSAVLLDATCVHPVDAGWPDQGPDLALLHHGAAFWPVEDCIVGATDGSMLYIGDDIPVAKGTPGWAFVVVHVVDAAGLNPGDTVTVEVDEGLRDATSAGHTSCHLASLALNDALADRWKKEVRPDALGHPDFDGLAIDESLIGPNASVDTYRLGKSLRKKGFSVEGVAEALASIAATVNATLAEWTTTDAAVRIDRDGDLLTDRRYWVCELPGTSVRIPCGGTHVESLGTLGALTVALALHDLDGTPVLTMNTSATR
ncbi:MAG: metal-dependent hydrolase [Cryobacterium sp.]|uniref:metal-dependent hydrolase n=1 Tax=unclassified Cryobacterium TaxID=2649013 RepID=UPI0018CA2EB8|nr:MULTISPECIES: metal-dependent hydrolase [unclassified Cryobacterium]MCY7403969.1 metal-dependent hydrolase [Cryobacterium sp.]MEC5155296.1 Ser-tRNA(Ala) deacylase AlaX [Cryobacterium sp. CAN_C3]